MVHLIDKDALVAEIEKRIEYNTEWKDACKTLAVLSANQAIEEDKKILSIINTLEVKEVDLDTLGTLASHLIACDAHGISPKYSEKELELLEKIRNDKAQKGE